MWRSMWKLLRVGPLVALGALVAAATQAGWSARSDVVAAASKAQPGFNHAESHVQPYVLPDPLAGPAGPIRTVEEWQRARVRVRQVFRDTVYGNSPVRPSRLEFSTLEANRTAIGGA